MQVIDLACGEHIPKEILTALEDEAVTKWAFNASFERICLSRFLGYPTSDYLDPESWRCSMIWAATMGLPLSLEGVGAVLGLENKSSRKAKTSSNISVSPVLLRKLMESAPGTVPSMLQKNGPISNATISVMLKLKWESSNDFTNFRHLKWCGMNIILTSR